MPDNQNVFFSIVVPAFNVEKYIQRAISSILNQSFQDFELILVNDGSTDNTANIINEFSQQNSKITVINHAQNESQHVARMNGVAAASGKFIVFLDGDDYFTENAFAELYESIQENPGYDVYEYGYIRQPEGEIVLPHSPVPDRFHAFFLKKDFPASTIWNKVYLATLIKNSFSAMERSYINNAEDTYESIVIAFYTEKIMMIKKVITNYQIGSGISTTYKDFNKTIEFLKSIRRMIDLVNTFLTRQSLNINLDNLQYSFLEYTIRSYIHTQENTEDSKKLFRLLPSYFDSKIIMEYLLLLEESYKKLTIARKKILSSKDYQLGRFLLKPLRIVKRLFKIQKKHDNG